MKPPKPCKYCDKIGHFPFQCFRRPQKARKQKAIKPIRKVSKKQSRYKYWLQKVARPTLLERDGDMCACCGRWNQSYDIDHIKPVGSNPSLKQDIDNMQLLCRFPCHRNKTDNISCLH